MVSTGYLQPDQPFPLVLRPNVENVNVVTWAGSNRPYIEAQLLKHGAILFRDFDVKSAANFELFLGATCGEAIEYNERSSPRSQVSGNVYTSTDYPPDQSIFLHNEQSYNRTFPLRIAFFCATPAPQGGATPIADTRKIFARLRPETRERFVRDGYTYVRNFGDGFGLTWQTAFQTTSRASVEDYCRRNEIGFQWKDGDRLKTSQVRPVMARHPRTHEPVWFNHLTFFHVTTLPPKIRQALTAQFEEGDLPNNTYYGDGSPIESAVLDELREAYLQEKTTFLWQQGDILLLDNMLSSHGREPFTAPRKVLVGMADTFSWRDLTLN
jgi:alpha-ketoglutarate-dependent taurine dioxygenase